jgi:hypothetical protein
MCANSTTRTWLDALRRDPPTDITSEEVMQLIGRDHAERERDLIRRVKGRVDQHSHSQQAG